MGMEILSPGVKTTGNETDHSHLAGIKVKYA
jgi:hypothetical protein